MYHVQLYNVHCTVLFSAIFEVSSTAQPYHFVSSDPLLIFIHYSGKFWGAGIESVFLTDTQHTD